MDVQRGMELKKIQAVHGILLDHNKTVFFNGRVSFIKRPMSLFIKLFKIWTDLSAH